MPIYEYQCQSCGAHSEVMQKITDSALNKCHACGKDSLRRLISNTSFQLKGGGYYQTDYVQKPKETTEKSKTTESSAPAENKTAAETTTSKNQSKKESNE